MEFSWRDEDVAFRAQVRDFLDRELPDGWGDKAEGKGSDAAAAFSRTICGKLAAEGLLTPQWPVDFGGRAASAWQQLALGEEMWSRGEPRGPQYMNVNWVGPAIMAYGTAEQKALHLPKIGSGDVIWCQGFSEPGAGSDLVALSTRAVRDGDAYVVNGQKTWTSYANNADYCFLLVRTGSPESRHNGISILLVPTSTPGFEVREVPTFLGSHVFHELFFTDMRVPVSCRLGNEDEGWSIIRAVLANERVGSPRYASAALLLDELAQWARTRGVFDQAVVQDHLGTARAACEMARVLVYRVIDQRANGHPRNGDAYTARVAMVLAERAVADAAVGVMGPEALVSASLGDRQTRASLTAGVASGTYEIQLNLVSRQVLGLTEGR